jgi:hypothetical protein
VSLEKTQTVTDIAFGMGESPDELWVTAGKDPIGAPLLDFKPAQDAFLQLGQPTASDFFGLIALLRGR